MTQTRDIVVIGGSSGSTEVLERLVAALPAATRAAFFIATHIPVSGASHLREVLARHATIPVVAAEEGAAIEPGRIYVAAPDRHLLVTPEGIRLGEGPRENMARPSVDPLFRSAALAFGPRVVGVILSGYLNDGASGLSAVRACGGVAVVQDPAGARAPDMPLAAITIGPPDHVAGVDDIGGLIAELAGSDVGPKGSCPEALPLEVEIALGARLGTARLTQYADTQPISCPNCSGVLSEMRGEKPLRFRCQTGHAVTAEVLAETQKEALEEALRVALRVMEERVHLVTRMAAEARQQGRTAVAELYETRIGEYGDYADTLRKAALQSLKLRDEDDGTGS